MIIKGEKYQVTEIDKSGVITEIPGELVGAKLFRDDMPTNLKVYDAMTRDGNGPLLELTCDNGDKETERVFYPWQLRRYETGLAIRLEPTAAKALICYRPLDIVADTARIRRILEKNLRPQWVHEYRFSLAIAETNKKIYFFPGLANYVYVKKCTGVATLKFNSPNFSAWNLSERAQIKFPFENIWLTWPAQSGEELIFYISNQKIDAEADLEALLAGYYWKDTKYEYDGAENCIYKGLHRRLNALASDVNWYILKYDYDVNNNCTQKRIQITSWDARASGW